MRRTWLAMILACAALPAAARTDAARTDAGRLARRLADDLARHASATEALRGWCAERRLADPAVIVAERQAGRDKPATARIRALLRAAPDEPIRYRRVALACGRRVLSRADNWYRPGRLTAAMNAELDATDTPFGEVVRPLRFHRERLEARLLVAPGARRAPATVIRNAALLETPDGVPFSYVVESYAREALAK